MSRIEPEFGAVMPTIDKAERSVILFTAVLVSATFLVEYLMTLPFNEAV